LVDRGILDQMVDDRAQGNRRGIGAGKATV
jgi:hypothetical protein